MTGYIHPSSQRPETHVCVSSPFHGTGSTWAHAPVKFSVSTADQCPLDGHILFFRKLFFFFSLVLVKARSPSVTLRWFFTFLVWSIIFLIYSLNIWTQLDSMYSSTMFVTRHYLCEPLKDLIITIQSKKFHSHEINRKELKTKKLWQQKWVLLLSPHATENIFKQLLTFWNFTFLFYENRDRTGKSIRCLLVLSSHVSVSTK